MSQDRTPGDVYFRTLFDRSITPMLVLDNATAQLVDQNLAFSQLIGIPLEDVEDTFWPDAETPKQLIESALRDRVSYRMVTLRAVSGDLPVLVTADVIGEFTFVQLQDQRVTELAGMHQSAVQQSAAGLKLGAVLAGSPVPTGLVNHQTNKIIDVNPAFTRLVAGQSDSPVGAPTMGAWRDPQRRELFITQLEKQGNVDAFYAELYRRDGETFPVQMSAQLCDIDGETYRIVQFFDLTERQALEEERRAVEARMQESQRLESLGLLAGGVAHDFNNLLSGIMGNADLALFESGLPPGTRQRLEDIVTAGKHASELTRQLLAYSGKGRFVIEPVDLNHVIAEMNQILQVTISGNCVVRTNLGEKLPPIEADRSQIQQILMNLIINGAEACEGSSSGMVTVTTNTQEVNEAYLSQSDFAGSITPGLAVHVEVSDNGVGMTEETKRQLFEPFYTTKFTGRGLGMAAVLGIVRGHGGAIRVYSELGVGTTVKILLPALSEEQVSNTVEELPKLEGMGSVLIVDDDVTVAGTADAILTRFGFDVTCVHSGRDALDWFTRNSEICAVVMLDLTMPDMDGEETFKHLRQIDPEVRVILMSGYNEQDATQAFVGKGLAGFLAKPFLVSDVVTAVQRVTEGDDA